MKSTEFTTEKSGSDLPQIVQLLATTEGGVHFWTSSHSGNSSDRNIFPESISAIQNYMLDLKSELKLGSVADSALYKKEFLLNKSISGDWMSRVPESIKTAKSLVSLNHKEVDWTKIDKDYKYAVHLVTYGGIRQRWLVVNNRTSRYKELATFDKNLKKEETAPTKKVKAEMERIFISQSETHFAANRITKDHTHFEFSKTVLGCFKKGKGFRPRSTKGFKVHLTFSRNEEVIEKIRNRKAFEILQYRS